VVEGALQKLLGGRRHKRINGGFVNRFRAIHPRIIERLKPNDLQQERGEGRRKTAGTEEVEELNKGEEEEEIKAGGGKGRSYWK